ncbi:bifunctional phosphopantothenoylcysteine decarboxylase/phosphopantothenate--cysteine ligase CoaBC [Croceicoccus sp. Ery15]|uniref:bifunctional phosphopantothenoylcysteine decarboxylase/phosphopantothenate--cysteine ligase CoaBC n=1 Tax=Croceicoccus sp. Ery15 TaxID=1703338 RepID=UPI001E58A82F|nr:bifunctional phosphopantothenoylcysteine decarboxylase/phosphopantothenate--cysteine ligase CoaBC [Croceicoccus sp. Ery15]
MAPRKILLIVGGGIAAYKACELVRLIRKGGAEVTCVVTEGGQHFVTPMTLAALSEKPVYTTLWDLKNEAEMGHIQLSREADLVVVCPATADLMAKMAAGIADDLATTLLLATDKPVMAVPAMNVRMWDHPATRRNVAQLRADGVTVLEPDEGPMACGEFGAGRLPEPEAIWQAITRSGEVDPLMGQPDFAGETHRSLHGRHVLVTAGPTHEPIDPVRYIANRSSGKQGFAIAAAAAAAGAQVTLIAGPVHLETPPGVDRYDVESAVEMLEAVEQALPADVAIMVAAVADWRAADRSAQKIKKDGSGQVPPLPLTVNPDILASVAASPARPHLLIGFAAETDHVVSHAQAKRLRKGADWIVANDVSGPPGSSVMGGDSNTVHLVTGDGVEDWPAMPKDKVAAALVERIAAHCNKDAE